MSRSDNNEQSKNPAKFFLQWDGTNGGFNYWDKNKGEKGEKVHVDLPVTFMVLDTLATIKGYSDKDKSGFWSNEIRTGNIKKDILTVRIKDKADPTGKRSKIVVKGLYGDITGDKNAVGMKFCQSVYVAFKEGDTYVLGNIQMTGSALSSWIDFGKTTDIFKGAVSVSGMTEGKKGITKYKIPVFQKAEATKEAEADAVEMDKVLKVYLEIYFNDRQKELADTKEETSTEQ